MSPCVTHLEQPVCTHASENRFENDLFSYLLKMVVVQVWYILCQMLYRLSSKWYSDSPGVLDLKNIRCKMWYTLMIAWQNGSLDTLDKWKKTFDRNVASSYIIWYIYTYISIFVYLYIHIYTCIYIQSCSYINICIKNRFNIHITLPASILV